MFLIRRILLTLLPTESPAFTAEKRSGGSSRRPGTGAAYLIGLALTPGCSFIFTRPLPPDYRSRSYFDCSTNQAPPTLDALLTFTNVASAIYVASKDDVTNKEASVGLGLSVAAIWVSSSIYGFAKTSQCDAAKQEMADAYDPPRPRRRSFPRPRPQPHPQPGEDTTAQEPPDGSAPASGVTPAPKTSASPDAGPVNAPVPTAPQPPVPAPPPVPQQQDEDDPTRGRRPRSFHTPSNGIHEESRETRSHVLRSATLSSHPRRVTVSGVDPWDDHDDDGAR